MTEFDWNAWAVHAPKCETCLNPFDPAIAAKLSANPDPSRWCSRTCSQGGRAPRKTVHSADYEQGYQAGYQAGRRYKEQGE